MERAAVLRVKRKRAGAGAAEALVLACKRLRREEEEDAAAPDGAEVQKNLFKLVATVASEDEPVEKYVQEAITKNKAAQRLRPSLGSAQRVSQDLRSFKCTSRQESRYRLLASHRPNFTDGESSVLAANEEEQNKNNQSGTKEGISQKENNGIPDSCAEFQLLDIIQEEDVEKDTGITASHLQKPTPDAILCNAVEMIRERLTISDRGNEAEHKSEEEEYVYDIYYMETASPCWIENILSVQPYTQDCELVDEDRISEDIYEDEDDENNENNWRNDYPDEDEFLPDEDEESEHGSISDEDNGGFKRTWEKYRSDVLLEFDYDGLKELDSE